MKKITRKEIKAMSLREMFSAAREPYRKLFAYLKPYKLRFALAIFCGAIYGALNGGLVWVMRHVTTTVFPHGAHQGMESKMGMQMILGTAVLIPIIMCVRAVFGYLNSYLMTWVSLRALDDIRADLFKRVLSQSMEFFTKQKTGDLMQTIFNQTRVAQQTLTSISSQVIKEPLSIVSAVAVMLWLDWRFTLGALLLFPLCIIPVVIASRRVRKAGAQEELEAGQMNVIMHEAFAGIRVVKASGREDYEEQRFNDSNNRMLRSIMKWRKASDAVAQMVEVVASLGVAAALVYVWFASKSAADFIALNGALVMLYPPAKALSVVPIQLQKCLASTTKIFELMERPVRVPDDPQALVLPPVKGQIDLRDVSFFYQKDVPALRNVSLTINPGDRVALVGPSGAGKTTLFSLILRFYDPHDGAILVDGVNIKHILQSSLRHQIGLVNQDIFLFHDTIYENIRYGRLDATEEEVIEAAKLAHAHDFILAQEKGYETIIGDKGCALSGGQQQRLTIARAFLRDAPILLLDEATASLDTESERLIQQDLKELEKGRTVIAIAHRLSTVLSSNKIVVMEKGAVVDVGTNQELLARCELYQNLYNLQFQTETPE